ncbi:MAG: polymerase subunit sigma-70 [Mucilaginibacter sp.]|nr:polymerase subunit sigma-70 [Mucilaginibacter sp.]
MSVYKSLSDQQLFDLIREDNQLAYTAIYDRYKDILHRYAYKWLQDREIVKDIVQELFVTIWMKRDTISFNHNVSGYLYSSVKHAILRAVEQEDRKNSYTTSLQEFADKGISVTDHLVREKQLKLLIEKEIAALPEKMREIFELSRNNHMTHAEIAELLALSEHTVRNQIKKALKILRLRLGLVVYFYFLLK